MGMYKRFAQERAEEALAQHSARLGAGIGVSHKTGQRYVGLLEQILLIATLRPGTATR